MNKRDDHIKGISNVRSKNIDDEQLRNTKRIYRGRDGRQYSCREVEANALIIQYTVQYRGSTELRRRHTFVFHVKQVDIAIDTSPMSFTWRFPPPV